MSRLDADYEMWMAMHDDCPVYGCGPCVDIEIDIEEGLLRWLTLAARIVGEPLDVFMLKAAHEGLRLLGLSA